MQTFRGIYVQPRSQVRSSTLTQRLQLPLRGRSQVALASDRGHFIHTRHTIESVAFVINPLFQERWESLSISTCHVFILLPNPMTVEVLEATNLATTCDKGNHFYRLPVFSLSSSNPAQDISFMYLFVPDHTGP